MDAALVPAIQLWDKWKSTIILLVIAALLIYVTPQNRLVVLMGSILILGFAQYSKKLAMSLEYQSFRIQLTNLASFCTAGASILLLSVFGRVFNDFVSESGVLTISTLYKIIVILIILITIYGFIGPYLWIYNLLLQEPK